MKEKVVTVEKRHGCTNGLRRNETKQITTRTRATQPRPRPLPRGFPGPAAPSAPPAPSQHLAHPSSQTGSTAAPESWEPSRKLQPMLFERAVRKQVKQENNVPEQPEIPVLYTDCECWYPRKEGGDPEATTLKALIQVRGGKTTLLTAPSLPPSFWFFVALTAIPVE